MKLERLAKIRTELVMLSDTPTTTLRGLIAVLDYLLDVDTILTSGFCCRHVQAVESTLVKAIKSNDLRLDSIEQLVIENAELKVRLDEVTKAKENQTSQYEDVLNWISDLMEERMREDKKNG